MEAILDLNLRRIRFVLIGVGPLAKAIRDLHDSLILS